VNISGRHFGEAKDDVVAVSLAGIPCDSFYWHDGKSIGCISGRNPTGSPANGTVSIETVGGGVGQSAPESGYWRYNPSMFCHDANESNAKRH
jgi:hypothetical protein